MRFSKIRECLPLMKYAPFSWNLISQLPLGELYAFVLSEKNPEGKEWFIRWGGKQGELWCTQMEE